MQDTTEQNTVLDQLTERGRTEGMAWRVFEVQFDREYPEPEPPDIERGTPWFFIGVLVISILALLFSATRTGPVLVYIGQQFTAVAEGFDLGDAVPYIEAILGTLVFELANVFFRFSMVQTHIQNTGDTSYRRWVLISWAGAFATTLAANLYTTIGASALLSGLFDVADLVVAVLMGGSGIIIAFSSGDVLAHAWHQWHSKGEAELAAYRAALEERAATKRNTWASRKRGLGVSVVSADSGRTATGQAQRPPGSGRTADEPSATVQQVLTHLTNNPDDARLSVRDLGRKVGVGKTTAADALRRWNAMGDTQEYIVQDDAETE